MLIFPTETLPSPLPLEATPPPARVGEVVRPVAAKIPSWFTAAAALRVARLKGAEHLLVLDRGRPVGTVAARVLAIAPGHEPVGRWMTASALAVTPETTVGQARRLMEREALECIPVVSGALLLGTITASDLG